VFDRNVEVYLTGSSVSAEDVKGRTVVVVDVLRTSATIVTALVNGAREVIPVPDLGEAGRMAATLDPAGYVLGGDKGGAPIEGYPLGNSPGDFTREAVDGRTVILHTSNGTGAILACSEAETLMVGGFINASAIVKEVLRLDQDLTIVCAGWQNRVALEDTLFAGFILDQLWQGMSPPMSDTCYIALWQFRHDRSDLSLPIGRCNHAKRLEALGYGADVPVCIGIDTVPQVPYFREQRLVLDRLDRAEAAGARPDLSSPRNHP
jgi:2-phosphosulfolactate phosphatase